MTHIIIPIKTLALAKRRLSAVLSSPQRAELVLAMLEDLLGALPPSDDVRVWVVAGDDAVFHLASAYGARPVHEQMARGTNSAVGLALSQIPEDEPVAVIMGDLPMATPDDIGAVIAPVESDVPTIRLAPSRGRDGTNAVCASARGLLHPSFGPGSLARYVCAARVAGIAPVVIEAPSLALDIDIAGDLRDFYTSASSGVTRDFLNALQRGSITHARVKGAA